MRVLVTGATGFVGRHLCQFLVDADYDVVAAVRSDVQIPRVSTIVVGDLGADTNWSEALHGIELVVHLAARVHVLEETESDPLTLYRYVNTLGSQRLGHCAAEAGVRRLVYVSTVKVHGETTGVRPFGPDDIPAPTDPYAISKWEAEQALGEISKSTKMQLVVLRPPLVYGAGVGANVRRAISLVFKGVPLPVGKIQNKRSMVAVSNLCHAIERCLRSPNAAGQTFLVSDDSDLSTPEFFSLVNGQIGRQSRIFGVPIFILRMAGRILGRSAEIDRLCESLQVDVNKTKELLQWAPITSPEDEMRATVDWFRRQMLVDNQS